MPEISALIKLNTDPGNTGKLLRFQGDAMYLSNSGSYDI